MARIQHDRTLPHKARPLLCSPLGKPLSDHRQRLFLAVNFAVQLRAGPLQKLRHSAGRRGCRGPADRCRPTAGADRGPPAAAPAAAGRAAASADPRASISANSSSMPSAVKSGWSLDQAIARASSNAADAPRASRRSPLSSTIATAGKPRPPGPHRRSGTRRRPAARGETGVGRQPRDSRPASARFARAWTGRARAISGRISPANPLSNSSLTPAARPGSANIRRISPAIRSGLTTWISAAIRRWRPASRRRWQT